MSRSTRFVAYRLLPAAFAAGVLGWIVAPAWAASGPAGGLPAHGVFATPSEHPSDMPSESPSASPSESPSESPTASPSASPQLPVTGDRGVPTALWVIGAGLLAAGGALLLVGRHLRERFHARLLGRS